MTLLPIPHFLPVFFYKAAGALIFLLLLRFLLNQLESSETFQEASILALRHCGPIPQHVAFIMDGNRRWARKAKLPAHEGHPEGGQTLLRSLQWCLHAGVKVVTVYAFSIENFKRSCIEVDQIMSLAETTFHDFSDRLSIIHQHRVRVRVLGDLSLLSPRLRQIMAEVMQRTMTYTDGLVLNICFAYTARHDIATAIADILNIAKERSLPLDQLTQHAIQQCLSTGYAKGANLHCSSPHPQLLVRTSGETRLSDFLLWEAAHSVLSFFPVLWPDLSSWNFVSILLDYQAHVRTMPPPVEGSVMSDRFILYDDERCSNSVFDALAELRRRYFERIESYCSEKQPS